MNVANMYDIKKPYNIRTIYKKETINKINLNYFVRNPDIIQKYQDARDVDKSNCKNKYNINSILKKIQSNCKKSNVFETVYTQSKTAKETGRFWVDGSLGLQMLSKDIRCSLAYGFYRDFDFKNCHPTILLQFCKYNKWLIPNIEHYVNNRENCLKDLSDILEVSVEDCKIDILRILNGGELKITGKTNTDLFKKQELIKKVEWFDNFKKEIKEVHLLVWNNYPLYANIVDKKNKTFNKEGSCLNHLLTDIENQCLLAFNEYLLNNNFKPDILCFDGIMVFKDENNIVLENHLIEAQEYIFDKVGFKLIIVEKEINNDVFDINSDIGNLQIDEIDTYKFLKKDFEKTHFKLKNPTSFIETKEDNTYNQYKMGDFSIIYENKYYKELQEDSKGEIKIVKKNFLRNGPKDNTRGWLADATIRTYEKMDFIPPPLICPSDTYNIWKGFEIDRKVPKIEDIKYDSDEHIQRWLEYGKNVFGDVGLNYLIKFSAFIFQYPALKNNVMVILKGNNGVGKNTFTDILIKIIGPDMCYETADIEKDITNRFSVAVEGKLFNVLNEISSKSTKGTIEQLKNMITSDKANVEKKNFTQTTVADKRKFIATTNNDFAIPIDANDRRLTILEASSFYKGNFEYFNNFYNDIVLNPIALRKIYQYLLDTDLTNFNFVKERPVCELKNDMIENNLQLEIKFLRWYCQIPSIFKEDKFEIRSALLYEEFEKFINDMRINNYVFNKQSFYNILARVIKNNNIIGISKPDNRCSLARYIIEPKLLIKWFIENKYLAENFNQGCLIQNEPEEEVGVFIKM